MLLSEFVVFVGLQSALYEAPSLDVTPIVSLLELEQTDEIELTQELELEQANVYQTARQTYYTIEEGETTVGAQYHYQDKEIRVIENVMHFNDKDYGWVPIIAVDLNLVTSSGLNEKGTWNYYGTILEMNYPDGTTCPAIVLDACGACQTDAKIDLWAYYKEERLDVSPVYYRVLRDGF